MGNSRDIVNNPGSVTIMVKEQTNTSIDAELKKQAREKGLNYSEILEDGIRLRLHAKKSDAPEESIMLKCYYCKGLFDEAYYCQHSKRISCKECELATVKNLKGDKVTKNVCPYRGNHEHILLPGYDDRNIEIAKKVAENGSKEQK